MATSLLVDDQQKQAQAAQLANMRGQNPRVMQSHDDDSSDEDDHPPQNLGNVFTSPSSNVRQQAKQLKVRL